MRLILKSTLGFRIYCNIVPMSQPCSKHQHTILDSLENINSKYVEWQENPNKYQLNHTSEEKIKIKIKKARNLEPEKWQKPKERSSHGRGQRVPRRRRGGGGFEPPILRWSSAAVLWVYPAGIRLSRRRCRQILRPRILSPNCLQEIPARIPFHSHSTLSPSLPLSAFY